MTRAELRLAVLVAVTSSAATACLFTGIGTVSAQGNALTLEALEARLHKLENRPTNRVRAPFVVVDAGNKPIVTIDAAGNTHFLRMGVLGSGTAIQLERTNSMATVVTQLGSSDTQARLGVLEGRGPRLEVYTTEHSTIVGNGSGNRHGVFLRDGGGGKGKPAAKSLGEFAVNISESGGILRLFDKDGKTVLSAGSNTQEGGRGQIGLSAPGKAMGVLMYSGADGAGELRVLDASGKGVVELSGGLRHVLLSNRAGKPAAVMRLSQGGTGSGGNFTATDAAGNNVVSAGALSGSGGALCVIHPKRGNQCFP